MKRMGLIAAAGAVLVLSASCAGSKNEVKPAEQPTVAPSSAPAAAPGAQLPAGALPLPANRVNAGALPKDHPHQVWTLDNGRTVGVRGVEGGCSRASAVLAGQDGHSVHITVVEAKQKVRTACTMDLRYPKLEVNLGKPLGDRVVVLDAKEVTE